MGNSRHLVILAQAREEGGPKRPTARGGSTEFAGLRCYVFQSSMRAPVGGSSPGHFFAKVGLSLERGFLFFFFATPLE